MFTPAPNTLTKAPQSPPQSPPVPIHNLVPRTGTSPLPQPATPPDPQTLPGISPATAAASIPTSPDSLLLCRSLAPGEGVEIIDPGSFNPGDHVLIVVSMNSEKNDGRTTFSPASQTGRELEKMFETFMGNPRIERLTLLLTSHLQRHNKALELVDFGQRAEQLVIGDNGRVTEAKSDLVDEAENECRRMRAEWLKLNKLEEPGTNSQSDLLCRIRQRFPGDNFRIIDWSVLCQDPAFDERMRCINNWYFGSRHSGALVGDKPPEFKKFIKEVNGYRTSIEKALIKHLPKLSSALQTTIGQFTDEHININHFVALLRTRFVLEETAMLSILGVGHGYTHIVYRGNIGSPLKMAYEYFQGASCLMDIGTRSELEERHPREGRLTHIVRAQVPTSGASAAPARNQEEEYMRQEPSRRARNPRLPMQFPQNLPVPQDLPALKAALSLFVEEGPEAVGRAAAAYDACFIERRAAGSRHVPPSRDSAPIIGERNQHILFPIPQRRRSSSTESDKPRHPQDERRPQSSPS